MGEVYEKALKRRDLSGVVAVEAKDEKEKELARGGGSTGKIVQLMSADASRCVSAFLPKPGFGCTDTGGSCRVSNQLMNLSSIVGAPFELIMGTVFLYQ